MKDDEQETLHAPLTIDQYRKQWKQELFETAKERFVEGIELLLSSLEKNSIDYHKLLLVFVGTLRKMNGCALHCKVMPNGRTRIFKRIYCCGTRKDWEKCPEYHCPAWPCSEEDCCPHGVKYEVPDMFKNAVTVR